jgi:hypothetical protein
MTAFDAYYEDHDDDIEIDDVEIDGDNVLVITIHRPKIEAWYAEGLDRVVIHVETEENPKFLI